MGVLKEAWDIVKGWLGIKSIQDQKAWDELLQSRNRFLKEELKAAETRISEQSKEKEELIESFEYQKKLINEKRKINPDNEKDYDEWMEREHILMLEIAAKNEQINFWKEQAIFLQHELDLLLIKIEKNKS